MGWDQFLPLRIPLKGEVLLARRAGGNPEIEEIMAFSGIRGGVLQVHASGEFIVEHGIAFVPRGRISDMVADLAGHSSQAIALERDPGRKVG